MVSDPKTTESSEDLQTDEAILEEYLVEEVSIDGMCGVY